jgi:predicted amidohydrolase YtcJ
VIHPEEKIGREDALRMYTIWAAECMFAEKSYGSIEPGKLADLVVIDRDYLTCPEDDIARIEPVMRVLDGKVTKSIQ